VIVAKSGSVEVEATDSGEEDGQLVLKVVDVRQVAHLATAKDLVRIRRDERL
jgi:hypothetical protein